MTTITVVDTTVDGLPVTVTVDPDHATQDDHILVLDDGAHWHPAHLVHPDNGDCDPDDCEVHDAVERSIVRWMPETASVAVRANDRGHVEVWRPPAGDGDGDGPGTWHDIDAEHGACNGACVCGADGTVA